MSGLCSKSCAISVDKAGVVTLQERKGKKMGPKLALEVAEGERRWLLVVCVGLRGVRRRDSSRAMHAYSDHGQRWH